MSSPQDHEIEERTVKLGLETPDKYEVVSGLNEGDLVVIGNRCKFQPGQKVEPKFLQLSIRIMKIEIKPFIHQISLHASNWSLRLLKK